ncbi:MAG TPA: class I SAM-dependent methyltransferase [Acidimicrobiales bacterium]
MPYRVDSLEPEHANHSSEAQTAGWGDERQVDWYLDRIAQLPPRLAGEAVLQSVLPPAPGSLLDLGCGDGRLIALALEPRPELARVVGIDRSEPMLARVTEPFRSDPRVRVLPWDLADSIETFGAFDVIVSGFAIHHLEDERKRSLFAEVARQLHPSGVFANLEVIASATPELHAEFLSLIGRQADDPEDRLADVESHLRWMREAGLFQVDCLWRWRGFALMVGRMAPD